MAAEAGAFAINDVVAGLGEKLIRRHPHVFGDARAAGPEAVLAHWEAIKEVERAGAQETGALDGLPRTLPALMLAQQMQARAARVGFAWPGFREALSKVREELTELERAVESGAQDHIAEEMGDVLFTLTNLSRYASLESEQTLRAACTKFRDRFGRLEDADRAPGPLPPRV
jgi:MazG family protein